MGEDARISLPTSPKRPGERLSDSIAARQQCILQVQLYSGDWAAPTAGKKKSNLCPTDRAAPCEVVVEVCCPRAACLASFGRRMRQVDSDGTTLQENGALYDK